MSVKRPQKNRKNRILRTKMSSRNLRGGWMFVIPGRNWRTPGSHEVAVEPLWLPPDKPQVRARLAQHLGGSSGASADCKGSRVLCFFTLPTTYHFLLQVLQNYVITTKNISIVFRMFLYFQIDHAPKCTDLK